MGYLYLLDVHFSFYGLPSKDPQLSWMPGFPPAKCSPAVQFQCCSSSVFLLRHFQVVHLPELSMGPFCVNRSNPTYQLTDLAQLNPLQEEKFGPNPTQPNTTVVL